MSANQLKTYGNLESVEGNESALRHFSRAKGIRLRLGKEAIVSLGVTDMTTGCALCSMGKHQEATAEYINAETISFGRLSRDAHFMTQ